jgi:hypothetical protein
MHDFAQLIFLGLVLAGFAAFAITLVVVSVYVALSGKAAEKPPYRAVTPARRTPDIARA